MSQMQNNFGDYPTGIFYPFICGIVAITPMGDQTLVTTDIDNTFVVGNQVQFQIPPQWGMRQLNYMKGYVTSVPDSTDIVVNINTSNFDAFVVPTPTPGVVLDPAQVFLCGNYNNGQLYPSGVPVLPIQIPGAYNVTEFPNV